MTKFLHGRKLRSSASLLLAALAVAGSAAVTLIPGSLASAQDQGFPPPPPPPPPPPVEGGEEGGAPADYVPPPPVDGGGDDFGLPPPDAAPSTPASAPSGGSAAPSKPTKQRPEGQSAPVKKVPPGEELVSIDFPEPTAIKDIIKAVGQWTGRNFILGSGVSSSARVQIISPQQVTREEAYQAFLSALNVAGFTTVDTGKVVKIVGTRQATSSNIKTYYGSNWSPMSDEIITQIIPLKYIDANTVSQQLRNILRDSSAVPFQTTNSLIVSDTGHKIRRLLEIIRLLDLKDNQPQVAIVPIRYTDAKDTQQKVQEVFGTRGGSNNLYLQRVILDDRTNSLILIGPPRGLDDVVRLIRRLDKPLDDTSSQAQIHFRGLDYADAEKTAQTLQALAQGFAASRRSAARPPLPGGAAIAPISGPTTADLGGVKITSDKATNSLIIQGSKAAFKELELIIRQLDKRRDQVYVEADVIDVNLGNLLNLKTNFLLGAQAGNKRWNIPLGWGAPAVAPFVLNRGFTDTEKATLMGGVPADALVGVLGGASGPKVELGNGITLSPGAFIFALKNDSNSNVLQTPSILVADNEDAVFEAVEQENILVYTDDAVNKTRTPKIERLDAILSLKLKPQISKADFVNMDLTVKADSFGRRDANNRPEQTNKRNAQTKVTVQNGQTIVIGGLNRDQEIEAKSRIPLLGDLPIIGWLFRNNSTSKTKTSLMVFITPHVVRDSYDLQRIYEQKTKARDEFLSNFYGESFRKREVFSRLPTMEMGKAPPPKPTPVEAFDAEPSAAEAEAKTKSDPLPSEDPNPIVAPAGAGGGGGGGGNFGGFSNPSSGGFAPPPPPPPAPMDNPAP